MIRGRSSPEQFRSHAFDHKHLHHVVNRAILAGIGRLTSLIVILLRSAQPGEVVAVNPIQNRIHDHGGIRRVHPDEQQALVQEPFVRGVDVHFALAVHDFDRELAVAQFNVLQLDVRQLPQSGKVFIRPVVTTNTSIAAATENTTIQAGTFVVDDVQITKGIYGGYVELSEASMDWSSPEVLGALLDDMGRIYANTVDNVAADALEAGTTNTNNFTAADIAKPEVWVAWMYQAASDILTGSNGNLPTHLFMAPNRWASLGNLSDDSGRPLFPNIGPMNAFGTLAPGDSAGNAFGLQVVVDRNLPSGTLIIGDPTGFENWEQMKGAISIDNPSTLSRTIAFRGYFASKMIDDTKFIKAAFV